MTDLQKLDAPVEDLVKKVCDCRSGDGSFLKLVLRK